ALVALLSRTRHQSGSVRGAIVGLAILLLFVLVRATSFHKVDVFINLHLAGVRANHALEIGGISIVTAFALSAVRRRRRIPAGSRSASQWSGRHSTRNRVRRP